MQFYYKIQQPIELDKFNSNGFSVSDIQSSDILPAFSYGKFTYDNRTYSVSIKDHKVRSFSAIDAGSNKELADLAKYIRKTFKVDCEFMSD